MRVRCIQVMTTGSALLFVLLLIIGQGCATRQQATELESRMAELKVKHDDISQEIESLKDLIHAEHDLIMSNKADVMAEVSSLKEQIYIMENRLSEKEGEVSLEFGSQIEEGEITPPQTITKDEPVAGGAEEESSGGGEVGSVDEKITYDTAFLDMTRGDYPLAIDGFRAFIDNSSGSQLLDNAQYWIGECYYAQGDLHRAIEEFEKVVEDYPRGNKIPSALFKIGKCYFELGDSDAARRYFKSVVDGYPRSQEANLSRDYLSELD